ncbi:hypothetical protein B0H10DRAFT_922442 [Mycena sp. CBHHK59/15]|nr:hypothetical protein B0H10DRAFT_922442 [Mycena sp. CBHHK59/15]
MTRNLCLVDSCIGISRNGRRAKCKIPSPFLGKKSNKKELIVEMTAAALATAAHRIRPALCVILPVLAHATFTPFRDLHTQPIFAPPAHRRHGAPDVPLRNGRLSPVLRQTCPTRAPSRRPRPPSVDHRTRCRVATSVALRGHGVQRRRPLQLHDGPASTPWFVFGAYVRPSSTRKKRLPASSNLMFPAAMYNSRKMLRKRLGEGTKE